MITVRELIQQYWYMYMYIGTGDLNTNQMVLLSTDAKCIENASFHESI